MREFREKHRQHMRLIWRQEYWRKKGFTNYTGVALGGMEITPEIRREVEELRAKLHEWNFEYYVWMAGPEDAVYDRAMERLKELEKQYPQLEDPNSPTCLVGAPLPTGDREVKHRVPMLSLDKAKTVQEVLKFFGKDYEGVVEPKIDGYSLSLRYVNGRLIQALTRGNGTEGSDVTPNARTIGSLPKVLRGSKKYTMEVRGEVFVKWSDFAKHNERLVAELEDALANPRNAIAVISAKNPADTAKVPLSFAAYAIVGFNEGYTLEKHTDELDLLEELGFITPSALPAPIQSCPAMYQVGLNLADPVEIASWIEQLDEARVLQDFPTDGLVFKINDLRTQNELGVGTTAPKWAVAFKYPPEQVKTKVLGIEWTVGKTGKVTPVANLEPVQVSGSTVARASLCNAREIKELGVNIGDEVILEKSNEIIPKIVSVVARHSQAPAAAPTECPICHAKLQEYKGYVDIFCVSPKCKAQIEARLVYAVGKNALDIDGCGPQAIATFVAHGVTTLPELLKSDCACFKGATKTKIQAGLAKALKAPFWRKLAALCIDTWGKVTCQEVATRWPTIGEFADASDTKQMAFILGADKTKEFNIYMASRGAEFEALFDMNFFPTEAEKIDGGLAGKSFCITGTINGVGRPEVEEEIRKRGGVAKGSVSRKLDFLVVCEQPGTNKLTGARRWGTKILTADQLFEMMNWRPKITASDPNPEY